MKWLSAGVAWPPFFSRARARPVLLRVPLLARVIANVSCHLASRRRPPIRPALRRTPRADARALRLRPRRIRLRRDSMRPGIGRSMARKPACALPSASAQRTTAASCTLARFLFRTASRVGSRTQRWNMPRLPTDCHCMLLRCCRLSPLPNLSRVPLPPCCPLRFRELCPPRWLLPVLVVSLTRHPLSCLRSLRVSRLSLEPALLVVFFWICSQAPRPRCHRRLLLCAKIAWNLSIYWRGLPWISFMTRLSRHCSASAHPVWWVQLERPRLALRSLGLV